MYFLGSAFFLGSMRRFKKLLSTSSSTSAAEAEAKSVVKKGLSFKIIFIQPDGKIRVRDIFKTPTNV